CEHLERFVECAKAAWKQRECVCLLHEIQLTGEEIIESNQFRIALDDFIGSLLGWEPNVKPETMRAAGAPLRCSHNSVTATCDHHKIVRHHLPRKILCYFVHRRIDWSAGRPKNGHFAQMLKWGEDLRRVAHFFYRAIDQLEICHGHLIAGYL